MLDTETAAIIAGASAIGGGLIVALSNYAISRAQARDARRERLEGVLSELGYTVGRVDHQLRLEPKPSKVEQEINETMEARAPMLRYSLGRIRRRLLEPELTELTMALSKALSAATIATPRTMLPVLVELTELMGQVEDPPDDWWDKWNKARSDYFVQARRLLGSDRESRWPVWRSIRRPS
ncbi:MAG: hypothetical protein ACHQC8_04925 [Solirubrobacterales bacterium]